VAEAPRKNGDGFRPFSPCSPAPLCPDIGSHAQKRKGAPKSTPARRCGTRSSVPPRPRPSRPSPRPGCDNPPADTVLARARESPAEPRPDRPSGRPRAAFASRIPSASTFSGSRGAPGRNRGPGEVPPTGGSWDPSRARVPGRDKRRFFEGRSAA